MDTLVHPSERPLFVALLFASIMIYVVLVLSIVGILYIGLIALVFFISHGLLIGEVRGNAVRISARQLPQVHAMIVRHAEQLGIDPVPEAYVLQEGGFLNAFATRFLGRNFVIIYSEVLELALEKGEDAVAFVIAHELGHIRRGHLRKRPWIYPALFVPFLGVAHQRACVYTCDRMGQALVPAGANDGLVALAAGNRLYAHVNVQELIDQLANGGGFWVRFSELLSDHPHLSNRLKALARLQVAPRKPDAPVAHGDLTRVP